MKIFIPIPDDVLNERQELMGHLVPFNPEYMTENRLRQEGSKPRNWISASDCTTARLRASKQAATVIA
jgi:hypothetical protein